MKQIRQGFVLFLVVKVGELAFEISVFGFYFLEDYGDDVIFVDVEQLQDDSIDVFDDLDQFLISFDGFIPSLIPDLLVDDLDGGGKLD